MSSNRKKFVRLEGLTLEQEEKLNRILSSNERCKNCGGTLVITVTQDEDQANKVFIYQATLFCEECNVVRATFDVSTVFNIDSFDSLKDDEV